MIRGAVFLLLGLALARPASAQDLPSQPALSGIGARVEGPGGAVIAWTTDRPADSAVDFGATIAYGASAASGGPPSSDHEVALSGLAPGTLYHYRVRSRGPEGVLAVSGDFTFVTPPAPLPAAPESAPLALIMTPPQGAVLSGFVTISANATSGTGVASVQFLLDGRELMAPMTAAPYTFSWNSATVPDGPHALAAMARDAAGLTGTSPIVTVTVDNTPPVILEVSAASVSADRAVILWKTSERSDSQVEYGTTPAYGASTPLNASGLVERGVPLTGLSPDTVYHYRVKSRDAGGLLSVSWDYTFTTASAAGGVSSGTASGTAAASGAAAARSPQKILTPALADGINDRAVFGPEAVEVSIVDLRGRRVFHERSNGPAIVWNCRDAAGNIVPSGVYIASILTRDSKRFYQSFSVAK